MNHKDIKKRLIDLDLTQGQIARANKVSRSAISQTIRGKLASARLRKAIATAIGLRAEDIWPCKKDVA